MHAMVSRANASGTSIFLSAPTIHASAIIKGGGAYSGLSSERDHRPQRERARENTAPLTT